MLPSLSAKWRRLVNGIVDAMAEITLMLAVAIIVLFLIMFLIYHIEIQRRRS